MKTTSKNIEYLREQFKLVIPDDVTLKIKKLCTLIPTLEWSGILLYEMEGTVADPTNLIVHVRDIIPMNIGSSVRTGFTYNEQKRDGINEDKHIDYVNQNEDALLWRIGLIHSHHNMQTYFSSVDDEELHSGADSYVNFLSLIVNNRMDLECQLSFFGTIKEDMIINYTAKDEKGNIYKLPKVVSVDNKQLFSIKSKIEFNKDIKFVSENIFDAALYDILTKDNFKSKQETKVNTFPEDMFELEENDDSFQDIEKVLEVNTKKEDRTKLLKALYPEGFVHAYTEYIENKSFIENLVEIDTLFGETLSKEKYTSENIRALANKIAREKVDIAVAIDILTMIIFSEEVDNVGLVPFVDELLVELEQLIEK